MWVILDSLNNVLNIINTNIEELNGELIFLYLCKSGFPKNGKGLLGPDKNLISFEKGCRPTAYDLLQLLYFSDIDLCKLMLRKYDLEVEYGIKLEEVAEYYQKQLRAPEIRHNQKISKRGFNLLPFSSRRSFERVEKFYETLSEYREFLKIMGKE